MVRTYRSPASREPDPGGRAGVPLGFPRRTEKKRRWGERTIPKLPPGAAALQQVSCQSRRANLARADTIRELPLSHALYPFLPFTCSLTAGEGRRNSTQRIYIGVMADEPGSTATGLIRASTEWTSHCPLNAKRLAYSGLCGHIRTHRISLTGIVALEEDAGSSPVGHPPILQVRRSRGERISAMSWLR